MAAVWAIAIANLVLHWLFNNRYGYFRDEFDYLACGEHLAWGYVDHPPLVPFLAKFSRMLIGSSLRSVRFVPALATSGALVLTAAVARELGGRGFALLLSAAAFVIAPIYLSDGSLLTTNCLEPLLWTGCIYFAILAIKRDDPRYWLGFGVVCGIGLEEKYSIIVLAFAVVVGLILTRERRALASKWIWLGGLAALLIFLPNLIWNIRLDWPFLQLMHNIRANGRDIPLSPPQYFVQQILLIHPLNAPIWIAGLFALLGSYRFRRYRALGWCYVIAFLVITALKGKNYYLAPIYPMLLAAGAVVIELGVERSRQRWMRPSMICVLLLGGAWLAPIVVPVLPVDSFIAYMGRLPFQIPRSEYSHDSAILPQHYADQFGWEEMVAVVGKAWSQIPPDQRADCAIFGQNYGQAGAIDFFGPRYGLPPAISGHQSYFLWGPRGYSGNCMIVPGDRREVLEKLFERVEYVGTSDNPHALERHIRVFICSGAKFGSLTAFWPKLRHWS